MRNTVLLVDDDESVRESLKKVLEEAGYDVVLAAGGLDAVLRMGGRQVDLLLLDINLPNQSGWDVFEHLSNHDPHVPVIVITGMPHQHREARAAGVGALFEKPVDVPQLLRTMEALLAEPNALRLRRRHACLDEAPERPHGKGLGPSTVSRA